MTERLYVRLGRADAAACCRLGFGFFFFSPFFFIVFIVAVTMLANHRTIANRTALS